ncbi:MAG: hypothetical protein L0196_08500 [candidate division Zixibacteria bacterium]|nr:hypothetical protein [candidate division Zixibacteria bacterium]
MREESTDTELQTEKLSIAEALNQAEALIESSRYKVAREKLQEISRKHHIEGITEESYRYHYLFGSALWFSGDAAAALRDAEKSLQIFRILNRSVRIPEEQELPEFVINHLKQLRELEVALLEGVDGHHLNWNGQKEDLLIWRAFEISASLKSINPLAKIHLLTGRTQITLGKLDEGFAHLRTAGVGFRLSKDWGLAARTMNSLARIHIIRGETRNAIPIIEEARAFALKAGDHYYRQVPLLVSLSVCQLLEGRWREALSNLEICEKEAQKEKDFLRLADILICRGWAHHLRGRLRNARKSLGECIHICAENNLVGDLKIAHQYLADLCINEGRLDKAETHLKKALEIGRQVSPQGSIMNMCWRLMGDLYLARRQYEKALLAYETCQQYLHKLTEKMEEGAMFRGIGICYMKMEQFSVARKEFIKAIEVFESCDNDFELAKTTVLAAENRVFALTELQPKLIRGREVFRKLEQPSWAKRTKALIRRTKKTGSPIPLHLARELTEKERIVQTLRDCDDNISHAAKKLGILRQTLQYKIKHYGIEV